MDTPRPEAAEQASGERGRVPQGVPGGGREQPSRRGRPRALTPRGRERPRARPPDSRPALLLFCFLTPEHRGFVFNQKSTDASFCSSDLTETHSLSDSLKYQKRQLLQHRRIF